MSIFYYGAITMPIAPFIAIIIAAFGLGCVIRGLISKIKINDTISAVLVVYSHKDNGMEIYADTVETFLDKGYQAISREGEMDIIVKKGRDSLRLVGVEYTMAAQYAEEDNILFIENDIPLSAAFPLAERAKIVYTFGE